MKKQEKKTENETEMSSMRGACDLFLLPLYLTSIPVTLTNRACFGRVTLYFQWVMLVCWYDKTTPAQPARNSVRIGTLFAKDLRMASSEQRATGEVNQYQGYTLTYRLVKTASVFLICVCMVSTISKSF